MWLDERCALYCPGSASVADNCTLSSKTVWSASCSNRGVWSRLGLIGFCQSVGLLGCPVIDDLA